MRRRRSRRSRHKYDFQVRRTYEIKNNVPNQREDNTVKRDGWFYYTDGRVAWYGPSRNTRRRRNNRIRIEEIQQDEFIKNVESGKGSPYFISMPAQCESWRCLVQRVSSNGSGTITRHRVLIYAPCANTSHNCNEEKKPTWQKWKPRQVGNSKSTYFVVTSLYPNLLLYEGLVEFDFDFPALAVRPLPVEITTDIDALEWLEFYMLGNRDVHTSLMHPAFCGGIISFRELDATNQLPSKILDSYQSAKRCRIYLSVSMDGVITVPCSRNFLKIKKRYTANNEQWTCYNQRPILTQDRECIEQLGFGPEIQEAIEFVLPPMEFGNPWDLETIDDCNRSGCQTGSIMDLDYQHCERLYEQALEVNSRKVHELKFNKKDLRYTQLNVDEAVYVKYCSTVKSDMYHDMYANLTLKLYSTLKDALDSILVETALSRIISEYAGYCKVTEDMLRKYRVNKWFNRMNST
jgi:hypothetical protein